MVSQLQSEQVYSKLNSKYLKEVDTCLGAKDFVQASEKAWGAFAQTTKLIAAREDSKELGTHRSIGDYVSKLDKKRPSLNLKNIYAFANSLHMNFYEANLSTDQVEYYIREVKAAIRKLSDTAL